MSIRKSINFISATAVLFLCVFPNYCSARIVPETDPSNLNDLVDILINVANYFLGITGSLMLIMFIYGGVMLILSSGNKERVQKGQQIITSAVVGLIIVFSSYLIIQFTLQTLGVVDPSGSFKSGSGVTGEWATPPN